MKADTRETIEIAAGHVGRALLSCDHDSLLVLQHVMRLTGSTHTSPVVAEATEIFLREIDRTIEIQKLALGTPVTSED